MNNRDQIKLETDTLILNKYSIEEISQNIKRCENELLLLRLYGSKVIKMAKRLYEKYDRLERLQC